MKANLCRKIRSFLFFAANICRLCSPAFPVRPVHEIIVPANDEEVTEANKSYIFSVVV